MLYLTVLSNIIYDSVEYRDMKFDIKNISMDTLKEDYETIKNELGLSLDTNIINFEVKYDNNKKIKLLDMNIEDKEKNKFVSIGIYNGDYSVKQSKISSKGQIVEHEFGEFNTTTEELLETIDNIELKKYDKADIYTIKYENNLSYIENEKTYIVNLADYSTDKLYPNSEIINASCIMYIPMEKVSEGSWSDIDYKYYLTNYEISSSEENYEDVEITIENINNKKSVLIDDIYEKYELMEELNSINIARWNGENDIDLEPDLFIKDNDGNRLGLCSKDKVFARRDIGETSVWYIVPSDLYDKINLYTMK